MNYLHKIKKWYQGVYVPPDTGRSSLAYIGHYEKPFIAKIINHIVKFWLNHWHVLFPVLAASAIALFIHFDSNSNSTGKTQQKENHQITDTNHDKPQNQK